MNLIDYFFVDFSTPDVTVERLVEDFKQLDSTDEQNERLRKFIISKHAVGELKQDDLENLCELGQGNGGVVWKTLHKPTKKIMARKVCLFVFMKRRIINCCYD